MWIAYYSLWLNEVSQSATKKQTIQTDGADTGPWHLMMVVAVVIISFVLSKFFVPMPIRPLKEESP